ncbi:UNVERIFIED_CONTAM: hypothetical protein K2H54_012574 [Gekko kuhli]
MRGNCGLGLQVAVMSQDKASQWEEGVEAEPGGEEAERKPCLDQGPLLPSREKSSGINSKVSSIDSQDRGGQGTEHPQTPGASEEGGSSAPESSCHQEDGMSVAFRPVRHIVIFLPTCQPEDPGTRDASVQVGVTYEDKATQWEEREEADPSLDKPSGAITTVSSIDSQDRGGQGTEHPQTPGASEEGGSSAPESSCHQDSGVSVAVHPVRHIIIYLPTCQPEDPGSRDASVQVGVTCEDKATQWEERGKANPRLDKSSGVNSKEAGMSGAFPSMHCRRIVVYLPTCLPEEDPGTRDASVQVGVTCEDKATQWEENVQADPSLDKSLDAFSKANSCPPGPTSSRQAVNNLLCTWGLPKGEKESPTGLTGGGDPLRDTSPGSRDASVQVGVTCEDKATQWEESVEADPSLDKPSGANSRVSSIDSQDRGGQGTEHPQTPGASEEGGSSAPESSCHQEDGMSVAFRPVRHIVIFLPTCQPEDPGTRDASVQVGVTCEDKATQWEEREEADPSLDKPSGANTTVSSIDSQDRGGQGTEHPQTPGAPEEGGSSAPESSCHQDSGVSVAVRPVRHIIIYLPTCQPEDPGSRDASVQVGVTCEDKATQWEEREEAGPRLDKPSGANSKVSSMDSQEAGMSGAFPSMHRRRIVVYLPTCQPEDPGTRDASVQVGVTYEDKATQWEEREEADPSLDKPSGANTTRPGTTPKPARSWEAELGIRPKAQRVSTPTTLPFPQYVEPLQREFCQSGLLLPLWDMGGHGAGMADSESPREGRLCSHALWEDPYSDFPGTGLHGPDATKPPPTFQEDPALPWLA